MKKTPYKFYIDEQIPRTSDPPSFEALRQQVAEKQKTISQRWGKWAYISGGAALAGISMLVFFLLRKDQVALPRPVNTISSEITKPANDTAIYAQPAADNILPAHNPLNPVASADNRSTGHQPQIASETVSPKDSLPAAASGDVVPRDIRRLFRWSEIQEDAFAFDAAKGAVIYTASGSVIQIPPGALLMDGREAKGQARLLYREFRDPADFICQGLTMHTDSAGHQIPLGMKGAFSIDLLSDGRQAYIRPDMEIIVHFRCQGETSASGGYRFLESTGNWQKLELQNAGQQTLRPGSTALLNGSYRKLRNPLFRLLGLRYHSKSATPRWIRTRDLIPETAPAAKAPAGTRSFGVSSGGIYGCFSPLTLAGTATPVILQKPKTEDVLAKFRLWTIQPDAGHSLGPLENWPCSPDLHGKGDVYFIAISEYGEHAFLCKRETDGSLMGWERLPLVPHTSAELMRLLK